MTVIVLISLLGALILILSIRLLMQSGKRRQAPAVTVDDYEYAREALDSVFNEAATVKRILSVEDAEFVGRCGTPCVQSVFFKERKKLALQWIRETRKQVSLLMDLHLQLASYTYDPSPGFEFMLAIKYIFFMVISNIGSWLMWLFGPFRVNLAVSYTIRSAANFSRTFSLRLERVDPTRLTSGRKSLVH